MDAIFDFITRSFNRDCSSISITNSIHSDFISKDCFQHMLSIDISGDIFEVPTIFRSTATYAKSKGCSEICVPLLNNNIQTVISRRTVGPIMRDFLSSAMPSFQAIITSKGERYYGCPGIILDQDYNPLLVLTQVISKGRTTNYRCRISNDVFVHQDRLIEKTIFKKFLPTLAVEFTNTESKFDGVFVGDINLVIKPVAPTPNKDINEDISKFLIENIGDII